MASFGYKGDTYYFPASSTSQLEELMCPICHDLFCDPCHTDCGHIFCNACIATSFNCPICEKSFKTFSDQQTARIIGSLQVKCLNSKQGCEWQGDLGDSDTHLSACKYHVLPCPKGCGVQLQRQHFDSHFVTKCKMRAFTCPLCYQKSDTVQDTSSHFTVCGAFPLPCPAECDTNVMRAEMENHLATCQEEIVACTYAIVGCDAVMKRKDTKKHLADKKEQHFTLSMNMVDTYAELFHCITLKWKGFYRPDTSSNLPHRPWLLGVPTCFPLHPHVFRMERFERKKNKDVRWYSEGFYSHYGGYKFCLSVNANGIGDAKGTHLSAGICIMKGENDDNLRWPFTGRIIVSLLNQLQPMGHVTVELWPLDKNIPEAISGRVADGRAGKGIGQSRFVSHSLLGLRTEEFCCCYLKDDCLFFSIDSIELKLDQPSSHAN